jgi:hypothetical protein
VFARATRALSVYQEYLGLERGRPRFMHGFTSHALLRYRLAPSGLRIRAYHPLWGTFPGPSAHPSDRVSPALQPQLASQLVWPLPLSLAATGGISSISFPLATKMFQFTRFASLAGYGGFSAVGCPIRTSRDHSFGAAPPGFSQLSASFIASDSLTIHRAPLGACIKIRHACLFHDSVVVKDPPRSPGAKTCAGSDGVRTPPPSPISEDRRRWRRRGWGGLVEVRRFELLTPCLQSTCSTN